MIDDLTQFVGDLVGTIFGSRSAKVLKKLAPKVRQINAFEAKLMKLPDAKLKARTAEFRKEIEAIRRSDPKADENGKVERYLNEILLEAFALVREASRRTLGMRHFDVQLVGGMVLHNGMIAEMVTGEGKTLVATLPCYLNALPRRQHEYAYVHVVTVNDYLAKRDAESNRPLFELLGMRVGAIQANMDSGERHNVYSSDVVYGQNSEFGFDYLRDNMKSDAALQVQKVRHFAIVDEVDSILIDEARTPLIISGGPDGKASEKYLTASRLANHLQKVPEEEQYRIEQLQLQKVFEEPKVGHYLVDEKGHSVALTSAGMLECQRYLNIDNYYKGQHMDWPHFIDNALKAKELYKRGQQYEVAAGREGRLEVIITDEFTGRMMYGRRWSDGLHQAVEAKEILTGEKINMEAESQTLATITIQNFFKLYKKLGGMTGTALTEAREFGKIYKLEVVSIPTNRPMRRLNHPDVIYGTEKEKWEAICDEIERFNLCGRPMLVGTTSVEKSEKLAGLLERRGFKGRFEVLNAKQHEREAIIVGKAGALGAITVATNMAGRGTDIILRNFTTADLVAHWQECRWDEKPLAPKDFELNRPQEEIQKHLDGYWAKLFLDKETFEKTPVEGRRAALLKYWKAHGIPALRLAENTREVEGLHIIGSERHEARRIDNQLRGRSGRQGDPGSGRFFLCLDDDLMRIFAKDWVRSFLRSSGMKDGVPLESRMVSRSIEKAQRRVEEHNFGIRKRLLEYDEVMNEQRKLVYSLRQKILNWQDLRETTTDWILDTVANLVGEVVPDHETLSEEGVPLLVKACEREFKLKLNPNGLAGQSAEGLEEEVSKQAMAHYETIEKRLGEAETARWEFLRYEDKDLSLTGDERLEWFKKKIADSAGIPLERVVYATEWRMRGQVVVPLDGKSLVVLHPEEVLAGDLPTLIHKPVKVQGMRVLEHFHLLRSIDTHWKDHLHSMDVLRDGIYLRGIAQKDPKNEYKREGFDLFREMFTALKQKGASNIFHEAVQSAEHLENLQFLAAREVKDVFNADEAQATHAEARSSLETMGKAAPEGQPGATEEMAAQSEKGGADVKAITTIRRTEKDVRPNDPCPCGSGKKFKKCCGRFGGDASRGIEVGEAKLGG